MTSTSSDLVNDFGDGEEIGSHHYRAWVGPPEYYDRIGALQFCALATLGLREHHALLDVGCGSLRGGRLSVMYLRPGNYYGIEPAAWALEDGKQAHLGDGLLAGKQPTFSNDDNYTLTTFGRQFDYVMVHSVFTHAPAVQISRCLAQAREVLHAGSVLVGTFLEGEADHVGDDWVYPWVTEYTKDTITRLVREAGLACVHLDWPHPFDQRWFLAVDPATPIDVDGLDLGSAFSYPTYLQDELEQYSGPRRSHVDYLREDLAKRAEGKRHLPR
ncbi:class I SAM-dependent methyltransferase [Amycolatopsis sp. H20-H5]|uniref:class I SAM-dependent methyltransferase n=1 Tax=Amycolatopsis sp. H20-H5 TaxID=3046309 RepID=UPI002DB95733|nr:class I SAM-dependent methyltransferase [Amycolatopsis sp. H20-H5]MEC3979003.1 class I SAM-dependent methyltransferase [Amycolatopsis sp. H20-H5]